MTNENIEKEMKESVKNGRKIVNKVVIGTVAVGAVYLLGASRGVKIGEARGYVKGYAKATHDIADMIRQGVSSVKTD